MDKIKDKIAKLLAKAERTDNEHERDAFNAQAERMMLRLGIEKAELEAAGEVKPENIVEVSRLWTGNYAIVMVPFVRRISRAWGNLTVLQSSNHNGMRRYTYVIGHKSDVEEFLTLIDSLALQVMSALKRWQREHREDRRWHTDMEKYVENRSFIEGFGVAVARRLQQERKEEETTASTGAALVLASKQDRVNSWVENAYGGTLRTARGGISSYSPNAASDGAEAGRRANLGHKGVGGSGKALDA